MANSDFKVKKGLQVGTGDFNIDVDNSTAAFANGYTLTIGSTTVITDADNVSSLTNDANYISRTGISTSGDLTYSSSTGVIGFVQRTDAQVKALFTATGDITYESTNGQFSFNNSTGYITLTDLSAGTGISYNNTTGVISISQNIASTADVTFNTVTATTKVISNLIEARTGTDVTVDDNLIVSGNLTVNGTTTSLNTTTLDVEDLNITVAKGAADAAAADGAGITVDGAGATFVYAATGDKWVANKTIDATILGNVTGDLTGNADTASTWASPRTVTFAGGDVTGTFTIDGSVDVSNVALSITAGSIALGTDTTGQYASTIAVSGVGISATAANVDDATAYTITSNATDANTASTLVARDASGNFIAGTITADLTGDVTGTVSSLSNHSTATLVEDPSATTTSGTMYYTQARFNTAFSAKTTDNLSEGTKKFFTNTLARNAVSATGDISYDSATGVFSFTERTDAEVRGLISATGSISYNSTTGVISYTAPTDLGDFTNTAGYIKLGDLTAAGDLSYNNSTGAFSFTERTDAEVRGLVSASGDLSYNSGTGVFSVTTYKTSNFTTDLAAASISDLIDVNYTATPTDGQYLIWDNANQYWEPATPYTATSFDTNFDGKTTDDLTQGSTNKYFSNTLARSAISVSGDLAYNSTTGVISYTTPTNLSDFSNDTNFITLTDISATGDVTYNNTTGVISFTERTDAEVLGLISATGSISYNSSTGEISFTQRTDAQVRGLISASGDISYNNTSGAITFNNSSGYITGYTETDTLDSVTGRGATTANDITVGGLTVTGDLLVSGTTTTINTATLDVADNQITLNSDVTGAPTENAGIIINRGTSTDVDIRWNETTDKWEFTNDGSTYKVIPAQVSDLSNDSNYITLADISATGDITYNNATGGISFNNATGYITRTGISATGNISYNNTTGVISFNNTAGYLTSYSETDTLATVTTRGATTTNAAEFGGLTVGGTSVALVGANISTFTNNSNYISKTGISASGDISYDNTTGVISFNNTSGYLTTETDTLATVTGRGATTSTNLTFNGNVTVANEIFSNGTVLQTEAGVNKTNLAMYNGYIQLNYINQLYSDGDLWLASAQQNASGGATKKIATANALGTDIAGNNLHLEAGSSTGTATGGSIIFKTGTAGVSSGSATNALSERFKISGSTGAITINAAYTLPTSDGTTGKVLVTDGAGNVTFGSVPYSNVTGTPTLATVATSGDYNDLINQPTGISDAEIRALFSAAGDLTYNSTTGEYNFTERTDTEVRSLISATGDISYNSTTGEISFTAGASAVTSVNTKSGSVVLVTDDILEDASPINLWFTNTRARAAFSATGDINYDNATGTISFTQRTDAQVRGLISAGGDLTYNSGTGEVSYTAPTIPVTSVNEQIGDVVLGTADILESGSNQYFLNSRARSAISASGDLSYNSTTGVISFTERTDAEVRGLVSATGDLSYNNTTGVISFTERTDAEVRGLISATGDISYNSTTGAISFNNTSNYLTSYTEIDTLDSVTGRGATTTNDVTVGGLTVTGNLTVSGTTTTVNTATLDVADNEITLNSDVTGNPTENAGISVKRGVEASVGVRWNETTDRWTFTNDGTAYKVIPVDLSELTNTAGYIKLDGLSAGGDLAYNNTTGVISFTERTDAEVRGLVSATGDLSYNNTTGVISFTERTDAEVRGLVSATGDIAYNNTTGVISFTERTDAEVRGLVSATGDIAYNNTTGVISFTERTDAEVRGLISTTGDISYDNATGTISFIERTNAEVRGLVSSTGDISYNSTTGVFSFNNNSGYITSANITETDTLQSVTNRGNTTTNSITVNDITVNGNLIVSGTTTTINTATLNVADNIVTLNSDVVTGAPTQNAGIEVSRGTEAKVAVRWNETSDRWEYTNNGSTYINFATNLSDLNDDLGLLTLSSISATGNISYNNSTGVFSFNNTSGFITGESDTFASVTARGNTTTNALVVNSSITVQNEIYSQGVALKYANAADQPQLEIGSNYFRFENILDTYVDTDDLYLSRATTDTTGGTTRRLVTADGVGTNISGSTLEIVAGASTGNAASGNILFKTGVQGSTSNNIANIKQTRLSINGTTGAIRFNDAYTFPTASGANGTYLGSDGSGGVTFRQINFSELAGNPQVSQVGLTGEYADLLNVPTTLSNFTDDVGYYTDGSQMIGDLKGSVFGDDSTVLVDSVNNKILTSALTQEGATTGQALVWNEFNERWEPGTVDGASIDIILDQIGDIDTTGKQVGDYLRYNGTAWVPVSAASQTGINAEQAEELAFAAALIMG